MQRDQRLTTIAMHRRTSIRRARVGCGTPMFRYKTVIGRRFAPQTPPIQLTEAKVECNVLSPMKGFGIPVLPAPLRRADRERRNATTGSVRATSARMARPGAGTCGECIPRAPPTCGMLNLAWPTFPSMRTWTEIQTKWGMTLFCQFTFNTSELFIQLRSLARAATSLAAHASSGCPCPDLLRRHAINSDRRSSGRTETFSSAPALALVDRALKGGR